MLLHTWLFLFPPPFQQIEAMRSLSVSTTFYLGRNNRIISLGGRWSHPVANRAVCPMLPDAPTLKPNYNDGEEAYGV